MVGYASTGWKTGGVSEHEFASKFHLGISHSFLHYFQNGVQCGYLVEKNLGFLGFLCISLGSEKITSLFYFPKCKEIMWVYI